MTDDWRDYDTHIMQQGRSRNNTFHSTDECVRIDNDGRSVDRSESFLVWHEPEPCEYCHDDVEHETTDGDPECQVQFCETTVDQGSAYCTQHKLLDDDRLVTDGGTDRPDPADDPAACSKCGVHIGLASDDYCDPCAREIGTKPPMQRCMHCGKSYPQELMDDIDISDEDEYYPEIRYLCADCAGGDGS